MCPALTKEILEVHDDYVHTILPLPQYPLILILTPYIWVLCKDSRNALSKFQYDL